TGKRRTRKTTLPVMSSASSTRATLATTSSFRPRSAPSSIKAARAFSTRTLPAPRPCPLRGPLHHEVGHHYIYAVLHHPEYRQRYSANLRRELPRIPFVSATPGAKAQLEGAPNAALKRRSSTVTSSRSMLTSSNDGVRVGASVEERPFSAASEQEDSRALAPVPSDLDVFHAFARAGQRLAEIHVHYEQQPEYPLTKTEKSGEKLDYRVTKMRLSKDKTSLIYNQFLTLSAIPPDTYEYRLGNRSALEWV